MEKLTADQIAAELAKAKGWTLNESGEITRTVTLTSFLQALVFVNAVGLLAEAMQHHPDITIKYKHVTLTLSTHDVGGLSAKDFVLAAQINQLPQI
ncbi:MAG TPA: 4a-hydroxytetrahydrobiopterin dehydratase [Anaerolineae bacterium]